MFNRLYLYLSEYPNSLTNTFAFTILLLQVVGSVPQLLEVVSCQRMSSWGERMASVVTACGPRPAHQGLPYHRRVEK